MTNPITVRDCAQAIIDASAMAASDPEHFRSAVHQPVGRLLQRDDLAMLGVPRQGNNVANSWFLYFDGQLSILLFEVPDDAPIPPHDHGVWEAFCVYRGRVRHRVWQRTDDGELPGRATLHTVSDEELQAGDMAIVAPPMDIHGFASLEPGSLGITIVNGAYKEERLYYDPQAGTCVSRRPANRH